MTRLLFLLDERAFLILEETLSPQALLEAVRAGTWRLPQPYTAMLPPDLPLTAAAQAGWVLIFPAWPIPGSYNPGRLHLDAPQRRLLVDLVAGLTLKQIAVRMHLHPRTVTRNVARLKAALGASTRLELAVRAVQLGISLGEDGKDG